MASIRAGIELKTVTDQQDSETYRFEYNQETTPASIAVIAALSEAMDADPIDLEPLQYTIDTDALGKLARVQGTTNKSVTIAFTYEGYSVTVTSYGVIALTPSEQEQTAGQSSGIAHK